MEKEKKEVNVSKRQDKIKAIIFDAGGVLFETNWLALKNEIFKKYGFSVFLYSDHPKKFSQKFKGIEIGKISLKEIIKALIRSNKIDKIIRDYKKFYIKNERINNRLFKFIKKLRKKYSLFCLTNTNDLHLEANLEKGVFKDFNKVYGSCKLGVKKPDKRAFYFVLKDNKIEPKEALFIDNNPLNVKQAKKLRIKSILFKNNKQLLKQLAKIGVDLK